MQAIALFFLASVAVGGVAWVFLYPILSGDRKAEQRMANVAKSEPVNVSRRQPKSRREAIEIALKEFEQRHKKSKSVPLAARISQAGLLWSKRQFFLISAGIAVGMFLLGILTGAGLLVGAALAFTGAFGIPRWLLSYLKKRREAKFLNSFPDAIDIIVRGAKTGLPLLDCLKIISLEAQEPVRSEFRTIVESQAVGLPIGEACGKLYERMPLAEANFFGIVVTVQQRAGGNISEALGNLSRVLRDRKKMKAKIKAMAQEAKASATIIGVLPIAVMTLVYLTSPDYISLLWTEPLGRVMLGASACWMSMGVWVMKKMINFDF
ncbi:MAG TPA: type II secretion system F family protein [Pseudolabrys sp.]|jgi:tight adherence protein B|nr:type II secretion system F family protein [Pseudolabrys sp.]